MSDSEEKSKFRSNSQTEFSHVQNAEETRKVIQKHFNHVNIAVRLGQISAEEVESNAQTIIDVQEDNSLIAYHPDSREGLLYKFDYCFPQSSSFNQIFETIGVPALNAVLEGYNASMISYGPSKTGKTKLFFGSEEDYGLIRKIASEAFLYFANTPKNVGYSVVCSFWEMNDREVFDLFNPNAKLQYKVRSHPDFGVYITNLSEFMVNSLKELDELISSGTSTSEMATKTRGARWHSFFKLKLIREDSHHPELAIKSSFLFANLKGTDRIGQMGARGKLLKQVAALNKSMTSLGNAIHNVVKYSNKRLKQAKNKKDSIAIKKNLHNEVRSIFGDTALTAMLSEALGGNFCTTMICNVSPTEYYYLETMEALENVRIASQIPTYPQRGDLKTDAYYLYKKIQELKASLPEDTLSEDHPLTEAQEKLQELELQFRNMSQDRPSVDRRTIVKEVESPELPEDADYRLWKKNDIHANKHGTRSTFYYPKKTGVDRTYKGQWANNKKDGEGTYETPTFKYEGGWKDGMKDGFGTYWIKVKKDTNKKKSETKKPKKYEYIRIYKGDWKEDKKHGHGVYFYDDGSIYEGEWANDKREGKGTLYNKNGSKFEGEWANDLQDGFGVQYEKNSDRFEGYYLNGLKHGPGVYFYVQKQRKYEGEWKEGIAKCGELSEIHDHEDDAEIEKITGECLLIPRLEVQKPQTILIQRIDEIRQGYSPSKE